MSLAEHTDPSSPPQHFQSPRAVSPLELCPHWSCVHAGTVSLLELCPHLGGVPTGAVSLAQHTDPSPAPNSPPPAQVTAQQRLILQRRQLQHGERALEEKERQGQSRGGHWGLFSLQLEVSGGGVGIGIGICTDTDLGLGLGLSLGLRLALGLGLGLALALGLALVLGLGLALGLELRLGLGTHTCVGLARQLRGRQ